MAVYVRLADGGTVQIQDAVTYAVDGDQRVHLEREGGVTAATFAPGQWAYALIVADEDGDD